MKHRTCLVVVLLLIGVWIGGGSYARPKGEAAAPGAGVDPTEETEHVGVWVDSVNDPTFGNLLAQYTKNRDALREARSRAARGRAEEERARRRAHVVKMAARESELRQELEEKVKAGRGKLFGGEGYEPECALVEAGSAASARILAPLIDKGVVETRVVLGLLFGNAEDLCPEWIECVRKACLSDDAKVRDYAIKCLYRKGVDTGRHRAYLLDRVAEEADAVALDTLLFHVEGGGSEISPVPKAEGVSLLDRPAGRASDPELRAVCARYAVRAGEPQRASEICESWLAQKHKGVATPDAPPPDDDLSLARARTVALNLMVYELDDERSLKAVYDLSRSIDRERVANRGKHDDEWISSAAYNLVRQEVTLARSLLAATSQTKGGSHDR